MGPVHVDIARGGVFVGDEARVEPLAGSADVTVAPFDPRTTDDDALAHHVSLGIDGKGALPDAGRFAVHLPNGATLGGAVDVPRFVLHVKDGVARKDSRVESVARKLTLTAGDDHVTGAFALDGNVAATADGRRERLTLRVEGTNLEAGRSGLAIGEAQRLVATGDASELDLFRPLTDLHGVLDVTEADVPDAGALAWSFPKPSALALRGGRLRGDAHLEAWLADKRATGQATLQAEGVDFRGAGSRVSATGDQGRFGPFFPMGLGPRRGHPGRPSLCPGDGSMAVAGDVLGSVSASQGSAQSASVESPEVRVAVTGVQGSLRASGRGELRAERLDFEAHADRWDAAHPTVSGVEMRLALHNASAQDARALQPLLPPGSPWVVESGSARGSADVTISSDGRGSGSREWACGKQVRTFTRRT